MSASSESSCARHQTPAPPIDGSVLRPAPHTAHVRKSPLGTSLRCPINCSFPSTAHETKIRRWTTLLAAKHRPRGVLWFIFAPALTETQLCP
jgi:hypothetical protein